MNVWHVPKKVPNTLRCDHAAESMQANFEFGDSSCWIRPPVTFIFRTDSDSLTLETRFLTCVTLKLALLFGGEYHSWKMKKVFHDVKSKNCWSIYRKNVKFPTLSRKIMLGEEQRQSNSPEEFSVFQFLAILIILQ